LGIGAPVAPAACPGNVAIAASATATASVVSFVCIGHSSICGTVVFAAMIERCGDPFETLIQ
jgi:hypothetical protein